MELREIVTPPKIIAVIGLSDKPERPSNQVASYLQEHGFTIIPVNPMIKEVFGIPSVPSISEIPKETQIDIVDIFRRSEEVLAIVQEIVQVGRKPIIWMQEGVISQEAKQLAEANGMQVIMDKCMMKTHRALQT
jgi:predicted CoA-binding protein